MSAPHGLRRFLLLVSGNEGLGYEGFVTGWSRVAGSASFERPHVSAVQ